MRRAIAADFACLPGGPTRVIVTSDSRLPDDPGPWTIVAGDDPARVRELAIAADFTVLIAPETSGILAGLTRELEHAGARLLGSTADAVELAGDKARLAARLQELSIRHAADPDGRPRRRFAARRPYPAVLKPVDGAGSMDTFYLADAMSLPDECACDAGRIAPAVRSRHADERQFSGRPRRARAGRSAWESSGWRFARAGLTIVAGRLPAPCPDGPAPAHAGGRGDRRPARVRRRRFHLERGRAACDGPRNQPAADDVVRRAEPARSRRACWPVHGWPFAIRVDRDFEASGGPGGIYPWQCDVSYHSTADGELIDLDDGVSMMSTSTLNRSAWIGLDIGGANIKAAHEDGEPARSRLRSGSVPTSWARRSRRWRRRLPRERSGRRDDDRRALRLLPDQGRGGERGARRRDRRPTGPFDRRLGRGRRVSFGGGGSPAAAPGRRGELAGTGEAGGPVDSGVRAVS